MLVLSRKTGQEIVLGGEIHVRVLEIRGNRVRLGFNAPGEVSIQRAELVATGCPALSSDDRPASNRAAGKSQLLVPSA